MMGNSVSDIGKSIYETITGAHEDRLPLSESLNSNIQNSKINLYETKMRTLLSKHSYQQIIDSIITSTRLSPSLWGFLQTTLQDLPEAPPEPPVQNPFSDAQKAEFLAQKDDFLAQKADFLSQINILNQKLTESDILRENTNAQLS